VQRSSNFCFLLSWFSLVVFGCFWFKKMSVLPLEYLQKKLKRSQLLDKKFNRIIKNAPAIGEDAESARLAGANLAPNAIQDYREEFNRLLRSYFTPDVAQSIADNDEFDDSEIRLLVDNWIGTTEGVLGAFQGRRDVPISAVLRALRNVVDKMVDVRLRVELQREQLKSANAGMSLWDEGKTLSPDEQEAYVQAVFRAKALINQDRFKSIRASASRAVILAGLREWGSIDQLGINLAAAFNKTVNGILRATEGRSLSANDQRNRNWALRNRGVVASVPGLTSLAKYNEAVFGSVFEKLVLGIAGLFIGEYRSVCYSQDVGLGLEIDQALPLAKEIFKNERDDVLPEAINRVIEDTPLILDGAPLPRVTPKRVPGLVVGSESVSPRGTLLRTTTTSSAPSASFFAGLESDEDDDDDDDDDGPDDMPYARGFDARRFASESARRDREMEGSGLEKKKGVRVLPHEKVIADKFVIDMALLRSNIVSIRYLKNRHHISIKKTMVSDLLKKIIERVVGGNTSVDKKEYSRLSDREAHLLRSLAKYIGLASAAGLPDKSNEMDEKLRTAMLEIQAGNTNEQLRREVIAMLRHLYSIGRISGGAFHGLILSLG
jgi:hypothetical protein